MITLGCDIGSIFSKAVILDGDALLAGRIAATTGNVADEIDGLLAATASDAGLDLSKVGRLVGTGNGADLVKRADVVEDEVACVGAAAAYFIREVQLVIDVGGQSITSMLLDEDGDVINFMRNDKCASGSGRFLEVMSRKLQIDMADIDKTVERATKVVPISSQCAVFAESEVITHVNNGETTPDILAGVCASVGNMVAALGRRFATAEHFTVTGGVARTASVVNVIRERLNGRYHEFPFDPQLAAAVGAALLGDPE